VRAQALPHKHYIRSPIEEASCQFEFTDKRSYDVTLPARMYDSMRSLYPVTPEAVSAENSAPAEIGHSPKVLLATSDGTWHVRFGDSALSIHAHKPYPGWEQFQDRIRHALRTFAQAAKPQGIEQIHLRYRNTILIPTQSLLMNDYFTLGTTIPHGLPTRFVSCVTAFRAAYADDPHSVLSLSLSAAPPLHNPTHAVEVNLDNMVSRIQLKAEADVETMLEIVQDLKNKAYDAFERVITDHTRKLLA
jgi:uncharacterized protein (TIGR04255 family)